MFSRRVTSHLISISWAQKNHHDLTDTLLTIIEENATYKVAFGFDKGDVGSVPTGGKKVVDLHRSIARKMFIDIEDAKYTEDDIEGLKDCIKNRIAS